MDDTTKRRRRTSGWPMMGLAGAVVTGILLAERPPASVTALLVLAWAFLALAALLARRVRPSWALAAALAGVACFACVHARIRGPVRCAGLGQLLTRESRILRFRGRIDSLPRMRTFPARYGEEGDRVLNQFVLRVAGLHAQDTWRPMSGAMEIWLEGERGELNYGDEVELTCRARRVRAPLNPGEQNHAAPLRRRGIAGTASAGDVRIVGHSGTWGLAWVGQTKRRVMRAIDASIPEAQGAILKCLILGERDALTDEQVRAFRDTGTMHFLAVSGLHVGLLAAACWWLLLALGLRQRTAAATVLVVVVAYAALAGFRPSVQRAAIMCGLLCLGVVFRRRPHVPTSLALALIVILLLEPAELFSPGLQLSFAAVVCISCFTRPLSRALFGGRDPLDRIEALDERSWWRHPARYWAQDLVALSMVAWLSTLPLSAHTFGTVAPCAPLGNILLMGPVWLVLAAGLPGALLATVWPFAAQPFLMVAALGAGVTDWISRALAGIPRVALSVPPPPWWWVGLCAVAVVAFIHRSRLRLTRQRIGAVMLGLALVYMGLVWRVAPPTGLRVTAVAVGEGNCMLVQTPAGGTLLFDAGSMDRSGVGKRIIAPALWSRGVRRIDCVVLSHSDADHTNGLLDLARRIPVGKVAVTDDFDRDPKLGPFMDEIQALGIQVIRIARGDWIDGFGEARVDVLWPPRNFALARRLTDNELSAVVRVSADGRAVLLTGDIEARGADMLLGAAPDLRADVLQVPHQGRRNPVGERLTAGVKPSVAIIPGGRYVPRPSPHARYVEHLYTTEEWGMIAVEFPGGGTMTTRTFRQPKHMNHGG